MSNVVFVETKNILTWFEESKLEMNRLKYSNKMWN